jgi:hypothetical protein
VRPGTKGNSCHRAELLQLGIVDAMDDETLLPYLAGCIDCDGYISISARNCRRKSDDSPVTHFVAIMGLSQVTPQVPELLARRFGARVRVYEYNSRVHSLPAYMWQISNAQAAAACRLLRPYLQIKAAQAALIQRFVELPRITPGERMTAGQHIARQSLRDAAVALNAQGRRRHAETPSLVDLPATG